MTQARATFASFEEYLTYSDAAPLEGRYELIDGELIELPPESELNNWIADNLQFLLAIAHLFPRRLIKTHALELQVPVLQPKDAANRYPDLVVLRPEHLELTQRRLTITLEMPPPRLVVEVLSPGKTNRDRDDVRKRAQYAAVGIPEYWLIDPIAQTVTVLSLEGSAYREVGTFGTGEAIASIEFPDLAIAVDRLWDEG
ncbi:Uma2 family endonuclease [Thermoleptolyngbya sp. C42_A2020_037]|uniref:Uma2 family endonuclease n=1 Tax=Thermoleptolyngbya sp. C42_A2020_037 TaxID=2747799 RepID=UPI001A0B91FD|nr:Uma2 family endonuclease [Thermoleptolyngbya sp. C42_A2020_037]MBF2086556.1 Uma2 family endonuclease [Thermoleptolyngbya sp. C42_A2020_037]